MVVDEKGQPITGHFLKPAYFSTTTNEWTFPESYVVDTEGNRAVMQIDHFTDFALTGAPSAWVFLPLVLRWLEGLVIRH